MVMSWIFTAMVAVSFFCGMLTGNTARVSAGVLSGAQAGVQLAISLAGSLCLWTGVGKLMERTGLTQALARLLRPILSRLFPSTCRDASLRHSLSANICANLLGLGNAATPMGILSAKALARHSPGVAGDELCRLIVLNTASIQLIPASVAAVRSGLGCATPFDILPAVWVSSFCSAGLGVAGAWVLGKLWRHG